MSKGGAVLHDLIRKLARRRARRRAIAELEAFDAAMLDDLGITRAQIPDYVDGRIGPRPRPRLVWSRDEPCTPGCCAEAA
jgi:uncharacterized protein YjiS (DUF1127 family)